MIPVGINLREPDVLLSRNNILIFQDFLSKNIRFSCICLTMYLWP